MKEKQLMRMIMAQIALQPLQQQSDKMVEQLRILPAMHSTEGIQLLLAMAQ